MNSVTTNFLQRRYGVSLGRRYVLAAAGVMLLAAVACYPIDNSNNVFTKSYLPNTELGFLPDDNLL
ncbi:proteinase inhibitor I4 serpin [Dolichospermum compactum]|jgi:serpin B|uniref:Serpin family proteinase inhibitor I4 n=1 Tax=Dolichospermum compactum NIES-806 TaxID=1973481 RepID=A0A1Z4UXG1_9CYAN|nr:proteinase inhibitor I4 serpin [Dolichospermum compactum]BAZ83961.1 serpin family proteinase inhibitor I4 [Dolichospermum compactum NIES-806]